MFGEDERCIVCESDFGKFLTLVDVDSFGYREWLDTNISVFG